MAHLYLALAILGIILIVFLFLVFAYIAYLCVKLSKITDKMEFMIDDIIIKLENLNHPLDSLKKIFNYIDAFDLIFKNNLKSGLSLLRRNSFVLYKLLKIFQDLLIKEEPKRTIFSDIFEKHTKSSTQAAVKSPEKPHKITQANLKYVRGLKKLYKFLTKEQQTQIKSMDSGTAKRFIEKILAKYRVRKKS